MLSTLGNERVKTSTGKAVDVDAMIKSFADGDGSNGATQVFAEEVLNTLGQEENPECPICFDVMQYPMIIPGCLHQW